MHIKALQKAPKAKCKSESGIDFIYLFIFLSCILFKTDNAVQISACHEEAMTFQKSRHPSPHKHHIGLKFWWLAWLQTHACDTIRMHYAFEVVAFKGNTHHSSGCRDTVQTVKAWSKTQTESLRFIQVIKPVNCCMSINKSVSPASVFLLSARGTVAQVTPPPSQDIPAEIFTLPLDTGRSQPRSVWLWSLE